MRKKVRLVTLQKLFDVYGHSIQIGMDSIQTGRKAMIIKICSSNGFVLLGQ